MLDEQSAVKWANQTRTDAVSRRAYDDTFWTLACVYDHGNQWGYVNHRGGGTDVKFLRNITDPQREDVRVSINKIHGKVRQLRAAFSPNQLDLELTPKTHTGRTLATAGKLLLDRHLKDIDALGLMRAKNDERLVLGTTIVRRTLTSVGRPMMLPQGGQIRNINPGLALVSPHEIIRDPSANSTRWAEEEEIIGHEKPRTTAWVKRNFGVDLQTTTTIGSLMDYQRQIAAASGRDTQFIHDSKLPGVVVYEWYFQDPDALGPWPWVLFAYIDPAKSRDDMIPLHFGPNPFHGCPLHGFHFDKVLKSPWARGVPHLGMGPQDVLNIGITWLVRMMQAGAGKWRYVKGSIDEPSRVLTNRIDVPIPYTQPTVNSPAPDRVPPPQPNPVVSEVVSMAPQWLKESLNMSDVQEGTVSKRGEATSAIEARLEQANATIEETRKEDDLETQRLLFGLLLDLTDQRHLRLDEARDLLGDSVPDDMIRSLVREDVSKHIGGVVLHPSVHRPQTPGEVTDEYVGLVNKQVMDAVQGRWEMMLRGKPVDTDMRLAMTKQSIELEMLKAGQPVQVSISENHQYHMKVIEQFVDDPAWLSLPPESQDSIQQHYADHVQAGALRAQGMAVVSGPQKAGQPSPPAEAFSDGQTAASGPAGPVI